jgi:hypothetical protein
VTEAATGDKGATVAGAVVAVAIAYVAAAVVATETAMSRQRRQRGQCAMVAVNGYKKVKDVPAEGDLILLIPTFNQN